MTDAETVVCPWCGEEYAVADDGRIVVSEMPYRVLPNGRVYCTMQCYCRAQRAEWNRILEESGSEARV